MNSSTASQNEHGEYEAVSIETSSKTPYTDASKAGSPLSKTDIVKTKGKGKQASVGKEAKMIKKSEKIKIVTFIIYIKLYYA